MKLCGSLNILCHCLSLGLKWKWTFPNPMATAEFSIFAGIPSASTFTVSSFSIWNRSTEISSLPLALFVVILPKVHLTLHSRMSGFRWVIHYHGYLGHEDLFWIVLLVFFPPLLNIFCFCQVRTITRYQLLKSREMITCIFLSYDANTLEKTTAGSLSIPTLLILLLCF